MKAPALIFIAGPTAVGKTDLAVSLALALNGEIICCDALQVYREIHIASDKPDQKLQALVKHHLIDVISVTEDFNVARYRQLALDSIRHIHASGKIPIIVGGSGMYMSVLLDGIFEGVTIDKEIRQELACELSAKGPHILHARLANLDPQAAFKIHPHDTHRILRALEIVLTTGKTRASWQSQRDGLWGKMPIVIIGLNRLRAELYQRIETRVDQMFAKGLVEEIKAVMQLPLSVTAQKLIGIPEIGGYLKSTYDLEQAKYLLKRNTRHYAKRQLTWFKKDTRVQWIDILADDNFKRISEQAHNIILGGA